MKGIVTIFMMLMAGMTILSFGAGPVAGVPIPATISTDTDITVNTTWDSGTSMVSANITVKSGATLRIQFLTMKFENPGSNGGGGGNNSSVLATLTDYFGIRVESGGTLIVLNSTLKGNTSNERWNIVSEGTLSIKNTIIQYLDYDGVAIDGDDGVGLTFSGNSVYDSRDGIESYYSDTTITSNTFSNINGQAIYLYNGSHYVDNNDFEDISSRGVYFYDVDIDITDNTFNTTNDAIYGSSSTCRIERNDMTVYDDGIYISESGCHILNNTINGQNGGDVGIRAYSPSEKYYIHDNKIDDMHRGIYGSGKTEVIKNRISNVNYGIENYDCAYSGGGGNISINTRGNWDLKVLRNNLTDIRYVGIEVRNCVNAKVENNTLKRIGKNYGYAEGMILESSGGNIFNNVLDDIGGRGIVLENFDNGLNFHNNRISNLVGKDSMRSRGAINIIYADEWTEWRFGPGSFTFSNVDIVFVGNNAGRIYLNDIDLTGQDVGKNIDIYAYSDWIPTKFFLYDMEFDNYDLFVEQGGSSQAKAEMNVFWSTDFQGTWESDSSPVDGGELTVTDAFSDEAFNGDTDPSGSTDTFDLCEYTDVKSNEGGNISKASLTQYGPYTFYFESQKGPKTHWNLTQMDIEGKIMVNMTLDDVPPILEITSPADGTLLNTTTVLVTGRTERLAKVTINGINATMQSNGNFTAVVDLTAEGTNTLNVVSTDKGENVVSTSIDVIRDTTLPPLSIETPEQDGIYNTLAMTIKGTTEPNATVTVQGQLVQVDALGAFETIVNYTKEGTNRVDVISTDPAGNPRNLTRTFTIDVTPPPLFMSKPVNNSITRLSSADVKGSTENTATVTVNGNQIFFENIIFETTVELVEGENTITVVATDIAGNTKTVILTCIRDSTPPTLDVTSPVPNLRTSRDNVFVVGTTDGDAAVSINEINVKNDNGTFTDLIFLSDGSNRITVEATDPAGNVATKVLKVFKEVGTGGPSEPISVTSPGNNTVTKESSIIIKGKVNELGSLEVNGENVTLSGDSTFEKEVALTEGENIIDLYLIDDIGDISHVRWVIIRDTTPPEITITSPDKKVKKANVLLQGLTEPGATVTVNGLIVYVSSTGQFSAPVTLNPGKNTVMITAIDEAGNTNTLGYEIEFDEEGIGGGTSFLESSAGMGLLSAVLVLLIIVLVMMAMMMVRSRGRGPREDLLPKEEEDDDHHGEDEEE